MSQAACADDNDLLLYVQGKLTQGQTEQIRVHVDACEDCRDVIAGVVRGAVAPEEDPVVEPTLPRGTNLGRYVLLDPVGEGAMGVVYAAYDPELDRKVALKLVRAGFKAGNTPDDRRAHVLSEAQAMARLSHPNVVAVYDVGTYGDEVFIAMEFVRGESLGEMLAAAPPPWRRTLSLYCQAGHGLAAAHAAGLIHRDFKPDNVLVDEEGRVRVTDFGVAALATAQNSGRVVVGTPVYMAPEQRAGKLVDARTDQYSFCVAVYEGLFGGPPPGARKPSAPRSAPPAIGRVLARGLREDPAARWSSMAELVSALTRAARPWSVRSLAAWGALALLASALWAQRAFIWLEARDDLLASAQRIPQRLGAELELIDSGVGAGLKAHAVFEALERARDIDVALGLAPSDDREHELVEAHELIRSADLPTLKDRDLFLLIDDAGRVLFNLADESHFGQSALSLPVLAHSLEGVAADEFWPARTLKGLTVPLVKTVREHDLLLVSARPVVRGGATVGAVLVGGWMRPVVEKLERDVGARVVLRGPEGESSDVSDRLVEGVLPDGRVHTLGDGRSQVLVAAVRLEEPAAHTPRGMAYAVRPVEPAGGWGRALGAGRWITSLLASLGLAWLGWRAWRFR